MTSLDTKMRRQTELRSLLMRTAGWPVAACGCDGLRAGSFGAMHPKSVSVAVAISDALEADLVEQSAIWLSTATSHVRVRITRRRGMLYVQHTHDA
jgi:hypothetical protein